MLSNVKVDHMSERVLKGPEFYLGLPFKRCKRRRSSVAKGYSKGGPLFY